MSNEPFSIIRRAQGLVDLIFRRQDGVVGYKLLASPDLDGTPTAYTLLFTAQLSSGYLDPTVSRYSLSPVSDRVGIRSSFNPDTFTASAGITDSSQFWLRFRPVDALGVDGADSAPVLILSPDQHKGTSRVAFNSTAPAAASLTGSLEIKLSSRSKDLVIQNDSAVVMCIAFDEGGGEIKIPVGGKYTALKCAQPTLFVRGLAATADFSVSYTTLNTPV
jgi:hypothetical protein